MIKPYRVCENVQSTDIDYKEVVVDVDTVFVNSKPKPLIHDEYNEQIGWIIGKQESYDKNEFIEKITDENKILKLQLGTSNMEMLNTITLLNQESQITQTQLLMEVAKMIEEIGGDK